MHLWRRALVVMWVGLLAFSLVLVYTTSRGFTPLSAWQYAFYAFVVLLIVTPLASEMSGRREIRRRMDRITSDTQARVRHRFATVELAKHLGRRPRIEARYAGGPFDSFTLAPRYAANVSPATATDIPTIALVAVELLTYAMAGRYILVGTATLTQPVPNFAVLIRPKRARRPSRHPGLPTWFLPRRGSDPVTVNRVASLYELAGLGPNSRIQSISVKDGRLTVIATEASERAIDNALFVADLVHSISAG